MTSTLTAELFYSSKCLLGESPAWHKERQSLFWVDIEGKILYEYSFINQQIRFYALQKRISLVLEDKKDSVIIGMQGGIARFDLSSCKIDWLIDIENKISDNRTNDGRCDINGRLWIGTMHIDCKKNAGSVYCIENNLKISKKIDNLTISNGIVWSLDNTKLYHIDSQEYSVNAYVYDFRSGNIFFDRTVINIPKEMGLPDGMTIDKNGMLWIAQWGGFCIACWNPINGTLLRSIQLPVPQVTSCIFGGQHLDQLFITTARIGLTEDQLEKYPLSGSVFVVNPGVSGVEANKFIQTD